MGKILKKHCAGCEDNYYNRGNNSPSGECWGLKTAKMIKRKQVGMNDTPPWTWKSQKFLSCYNRKGYVFINCEKEDRQR